MSIERTTADDVSVLGLPAEQPVIVATPSLQPVRKRLAHPSNYSSSRMREQTQAVVIHCTDGHEGPTKDADVAAMFARGDLSPRRSCHYVVDTDSITQCVPEVRPAWHCGPTGNARTIGIELCGRARQTRAQWLDELSLPMLCLAARLVAYLCDAYSLPVIALDGLALERGYRGITTHAAVGAAWGETKHYDPGPDFPMDDFVLAVGDALGVTACTTASVWEST